VAKILEIQEISEHELNAVKAAAADNLTAEKVAARDVLTADLDILTS